MWQPQNQQSPILGLTSQENRPFDRSCRRTSTGNPSLRFRLPSASPSSSATLSAPGPYVIRVKVPSGVKLMPHRHPEDRVYTVMSGVFYIGLGDRFDADKLQSYPPGSVIVLPGNTSHFHWAQSGEYVTQVTAIGPLGVEYVKSDDDPRNQRTK